MQTIAVARRCPWSWGRQERSTWRSHLPNPSSTSTTSRALATWRSSFTLWTRTTICTTRTSPGRKGLSLSILRHGVLCACCFICRRTLDTRTCTGTTTGGGTTKPVNDQKKDTVWQLGTIINVSRNFIKFWQL